MCISCRKGLKEINSLSENACRMYLKWKIFTNPRCLHTQNVTFIWRILLSTLKACLLALSLHVGCQFSKLIMWGSVCLKHWRWPQLCSCINKCRILEHMLKQNAITIRLNQTIKGAIFAPQWIAVIMTELFSNWFSEHFQYFVVRTNWIIPPLNSRHWQKATSTSSDWLTCTGPGLIYKG